MGDIELILTGFLVILAGGGLALWLRLPKDRKKKGLLAHCEVCGRALSFRRWRECLRTRGLTYPFKGINGKREEQDVRWLCGGCMQRAKRFRVGEAIPDEPVRSRG